MQFNNKVLGDDGIKRNIDIDVLRGIGILCNSCK